MKRCVSVNSPDLVVRRCLCFCLFDPNDLPQRLANSVPSITKSCSGGLVEMTTETIWLCYHLGSFFVESSLIVFSNGKDIQNEKSNALHARTKIGPNGSLHVGLLTNINGKWAWSKILFKKWSHLNKFHLNEDEISIKQSFKKIFFQRKAWLFISFCGLRMLELNLSIPIKFLSNPSFYAKFLNEGGKSRRKKQTHLSVFE